jgi:cob(I)alamin adenosyltransferase
MTKFYTRTGDDGFTGRLGQGRLPKHDPIIEAVGTVDEASAVLGQVRSQVQDQAIAALLLQVQRDLYHLMAELSATKENASKFRVLDEKRLAWLEEEIDLISAQVEIPKEFVVPGDSKIGAILAICRSVVRRAERRVAELKLAGHLENQILLSYLNRLSSLCFVLELRENKKGESYKQTFAKSG